MNLVVPEGCEVRKIETHVTIDDAGFLEHTTIELLARRGCETLGVKLPPGAQLGAHAAKLRLGDDTRRKLSEARWQIAARGLDDVGQATLRVPELLRGDRVFVSFDRSWPRTGFVWAPDPLHAKVALFDGHELPAGWATSAGQADPAPDQLRMVYLPTSPGAATTARVNPAIVAVFEPIALKATVAPDALPGDDPAAWHDALAARWVSLPRGVDGAWPVSGDVAIARGGGDDRGFARTLVARAAGGTARVTLAWELPTAATPLDAHAAPPDALAEVAVWTTDDGTVALVPPGLTPPRNLWAGAPLGLVAVRTAVGPPPGAPPRIHRVTTLDIPGRDPQVALYPGGRASASVVETLEFDAADHARAWFVPGPEGTDSPPDATGTRARPDGRVLVVAPSDDPTTHTLTWTLEDPPTCGLIDSNEATQLKTTVIDEFGRVRTEGGGWWLAEHAGIPVMPDAARVALGLNRRFNAASLPEPGLPIEAKGLSGADSDAVAQLLVLLRSQVRVVPLATDPELPRRLAVARREGVATPLEAALFLRAWSGQIGLRATWVLARPASEGAPLPICPGTYPVPLVVFDVGEAGLWVDPSCTVCGDGELPPALEGAAIFGLGSQTAPGVRAGALHVVDQPDGERFRRTVTLQGTAALQLRLDLASMAEPARIPALAARWAGPGGAVEALDGFADLGRPITVTLVGDALPEPFDEPRATAAGAWWAWVGPRRWDRADGFTEIVPVQAHLAP